MSIAFFDLDGTLIDADSNMVFTDYMLEKRIIDQSYFDPMPEFERAYFAGTLKIEDFILYAVTPIVGMSRERREELVFDCADRFIIPTVKKKARDAIAFHRGRGDVLVVVSATVDYIVSAVAQRLDIVNVIASPMGYDGNGVMEHRLSGVCPYQVGKEIRIKEFIKERGLDLKGSYAYGDSINDVQMLRLVDHAFAVDANEEFRKSPCFAEFESISWKD